MLVYNALITDYAGQLVVVAVPCNQFGLQEPGSNAEIPYCYQHVRPGGNFVPMFTISEKIEVNGIDEDPLYTFMKNTCGFPKPTLGDPGAMYYTPIRVDDITWNFEKFLVDTTGVLVNRYEPAVNPDNIRPDIDAVLAAAAAKKTRAARHNATKKN